MNHKTWNAAGARVIALTFVLGGLAACGERLSDTSVKAPDPVKPSPSAVVIGQAPAEPGDPGTGTPVGTAPSTSNSDMSKAVESSSMPLPGQPNDHSNLAPGDSKKAENAGTLKSTGAASRANAGTAR